MLTNIAHKIRRKLFPPREAIEGYENDELVETIFRKTIAYEPSGEWPLVEGVKSVLDFGGGCGLHYKLARRQAPNIHWAVVETPSMVLRARELATDKLAFFSDIGEAAEWLGQIELMHSNGAIQYTPAPLETIRQLCATRPAMMVWYRVPVTKGAMKREVQSSFLDDNGPGTLLTKREKIVKFARAWIPDEAFLDAHQDYKVAERGPDAREDGCQWFRFVEASA
jgi:putative methyltransferase (TIGR04325 family)